MFPSLPIACHLHQPNTFICDSTIFHSGPRKALRKRRFTRKGCFSHSWKQPGFAGEIGQEEIQEPRPKRLALTEEWSYNVLWNRFTPLKEQGKKDMHVRHLLTKHPREQQRPFLNTGFFWCLCKRRGYKEGGPYNCSYFCVFKCFRNEQKMVELAYWYCILCHYCRP